MSRMNTWWNCFRRRLLQRSKVSLNHDSSTVLVISSWKKKISKLLAAINRLMSSFRPTEWATSLTKSCQKRLSNMRSSSLCHREHQVRTLGGWIWSHLRQVYKKRLLPTKTKLTFMLRMMYRLDLRTRHKLGLRSTQVSLLMVTRFASRVASIHMLASKARKSESIGSLMVRFASKIRRSRIIKLKKASTRFDHQIMWMKRTLLKKTRLTHWLHSRISQEVITMSLVLNSSTRARSRPWTRPSPKNSRNDSLKSTANS